jgi:molecular chaperone DnaK
MSETIIGIDLGTTNSEVAIVRKGAVEVLEINEGNRLLPSFVGLSEDGNLLIGQAARNQYALYPQRTIKSIKRHMGNDEHLSLGEKSYTPQEISAMILKRLKEIAERRLEQKVETAVITVPAYFSDAQRQATREAGEIAGLKVARIINEPTAAALAYETSHEGSKRVLVYDLGGGTFDVSVVSIEDNVVEVLASHGNNHLGGDDFDQKIIDHVVDHIRKERGADIGVVPQAMARVTRAAEAVKIALSDEPFATIEEEYLIEHEGVPVNLSLELARFDYEAMIEPFIQETMLAVHTALDGAALTVSDLDEILLVGGTTRTPLVSRRLEEELGMQPRGEVDPDLCVAMGAAIQAAMVAGESVSAVLVDITPYTFGTNAIAELNGELYPFCFIPLIRKNTPIPVTKSEVFQTSHDGQRNVDVTVYQGEDPDALNNTEIGRFHIEGLRDVPAGNPVITTFSLDVNGILHVTAQEKETGLQKSITIDNAIARFEVEELDAARRRVSELFDNEEKATEGEKTPHRREMTQAKALVDKAEALLEEASTEDREDLVDLIESVNDAVKNDDAVALRQATEKLTDLIYYLES